MTCGTLLNNNFNTVAMRKMPKYNFFTITQVYFSNANYVHEKRFDTGLKAYVTSRMRNFDRDSYLVQVTRRTNPRTK